MADSKIVDGLLSQLLWPKLGYACSSFSRRLYERVERRAAALGCEPAEWLIGLLHTSDPEIDALVDAATVGHTAFFRHPEQFIELRRVLRAHDDAGRVPVRIWCAGCSSGEEAYSVAIAAEEERVSVSVLGTDVNRMAIHTARAGKYSATRARCVPGNAASWTASPELRRSVEFEVSSLVGPNPGCGKGPFDLVFCRNVLIYFDREDVAAILSSIAEELTPKGALVISPADAVLPMPARLVRHAQPGWLYLAAPGAASAGAGEKAPRRRSVRSPSIDSRSFGRCAAPHLEKALDRAARLLGSGQGTEAENLLTEWLDTEPDHIGGWFLLGEALLQRGERAQARAAFVRASLCPPRDTDEIDGSAMRWAALRRAEELLG